VKLYDLVIEGHVVKLQLLERSEELLLVAVKQLLLLLHLFDVFPSSLVLGVRLEEVGRLTL
jgi:hypothetical protein